MAHPGGMREISPSRASTACPAERIPGVHQPKRDSPQRGPAERENISRLLPGASRSFGRNLLARKAPATTRACYEVCRLTKITAKASISLPSEEAEGNGSVRRVGEKVAELARLRRRRLIVQPRVAELARLPWVQSAPALNPAGVARRVRRAAPVVLHEDRRTNRRSSSRSRVIIASQSRRD